jgi:hypothetical protein
VENLELKFYLHPKQRLLLTSSATEILYGGAAGGGKSYGARAALITYCLMIDGLQCFLFRRHYRDLQLNHVEGPGGFIEILAPLIRAGIAQVVDKEIRIGKSRIYLCHAEHYNDLTKYQGAEMHVAVIEEATQFPEHFIRYIRHRVRMSKEFKAAISEEWRERFPRLIQTANPGGMSHAYFRRGFVKLLLNYKIEKMPDSEGGFLRQFIPARMEDNPSLDIDAYRSNLRGLGDTELIKAMELGDWDAIVGNFFPQYQESLHVIPDFSPPKHWFKFRTFDWGSADPFAVYWWAVADGESHNLPRGALVAYRELYGCNPNKPGSGLGWSNDQVCKAIKRLSAEPDCQITVTDSLPFQTRGGKTIAEEFFEHGIPLTRGDTSRESGWQALRSRLVGKDSVPMLYLTESCVYARDYLPAIERSKTKPEDAEDDGPNTHAPDAIRLACTSRPWVLDKPPEAPDTISNRISFNDAFKQHQKRKLLQAQRG